MAALITFVVFGVFVLVASPLGQYLTGNIAPYGIVLMDQILPNVGATLWGVLTAKALFRSTAP